jgi:hypothetical protein
MMKHHTNHSMGRKKTSLELVDQILKHDPGASMEMVVSFLSQWGILFDDHPCDPCEEGGKLSLHPAGD